MNGLLGSYSFLLGDFTYVSGVHGRFHHIFISMHFLMHIQHLSISKCIVYGDLMTLKILQYLYVTNGNSSVQQHHVLLLTANRLPHSAKNTSCDSRSTTSSVCILCVPLCFVVVIELY